MKIAELLQRVHVRFEKNVDYPASTEEDFIVRLAYADDSITEYEKKARKGTYFTPLIKQASIAATGTGTDLLPASAGLVFLDFIRGKDENGTLLPAIIKSGEVQWTEVRPEDGNVQVQNNFSNYVFWQEGLYIRTVPAISGTITFPYLKKAARYPIGKESDALEIEDETYMQEYILGYLYLDDGNLNQYTAHMNNAEDSLDTMDTQTIIGRRSGSPWGLGM